MDWAQEGLDARGSNDGEEEEVRGDGTTDKFPDLLSLASSLSRGKMIDPYSHVKERHGHLNATGRTFSP